jgi:hypothetical protein
MILFSSLPGSSKQFIDPFNVIMGDKPDVSKIGIDE